MEIGGAAQDDGTERRTDRIRHEETLKTIAEAPGTTWMSACQYLRLWTLPRSLGVLGLQIWPRRGVNAVGNAWKPFRTICFNHPLEHLFSWTRCGRRPRALASSVTVL